MAKLTKVEKQRINKRVNLHTFYKYDLDGSIKELIEKLSSFYKKYPQYKTLEIESSEYADYGSCCDSYCYDIVGVREETDEEYEKRLAEYLKIKQGREDREKLQYELLKKKYDKEI